MKLRQKLAMVLAVSMATAVVPVVTMGASDNHITREMTAPKNTVFTQATTASALSVKALDAEKGEVFFLELENAEWKDEKGSVLAETKGAIVTILSETEAQVEVTDSNIQIPMLVKITGGDAIVKVDGIDTTITTEEFVFATTPVGDKVMMLEVDEDDVPRLYTEGTIADLKLTELVAGSTKGLSEKDRTIYVEMENSDFEFEIPRDGELTIEYGRGLLNETAVAEVEYDGKGYDAIKIVLPELDAPTRGTMTIVGIEVVSVDREPATGEIEVDIEGELVGKHNNVVVAEVHEYGAELTADDVEVIQAGQKGDITFTLSEKVADSISTNRGLQFTLENGYFAEEGEDDDESLVAMKRAISQIKNGEDALDLDDVIVDTIVKDEKIIGFEFDLPSVIDEITVEAEVIVDLNTTDDVVIRAEGRAIEDDLEVVVAEVEKAVSVEIEALELEIGKTGQVGGKITITESAREMLKEGGVITIAIEEEDGIRFDEVPTVEVVEGDLEIGDVKFDKDDKNILTIEIDRDSKEPSTIVISGFEVTVSGFVPTGSFDAVIGGDAIGEYGEMDVKGFITTVKDKSELAKPSYAVFSVGMQDYKANGEVKRMDVAPYVTDSGRMMVPVRFLADAIGVDEEGIVYHQDNGVATVTVFKGEKIIQLRNGDNRVLMNGMMIPMDETVTIKNDRMFVPVGEIARALGINVEWDAMSATATFVDGDASLLELE